MSQTQQEQPTQGRREEQEPLVLGDRYGIVVVWPDRYVRRFSWEVLRQEVEVEGKLTTSQEQAQTQGAAPQRKKEAAI
jgi:hypothetical protein